SVGGDRQRLLSMGTVIAATTYESRARMALAHKRSRSDDTLGFQGKRCDCAYRNPAWSRRCAMATGSSSLDRLRPVPTARLLPKTCMRSCAKLWRISETYSSRWEEPRDDIVSIRNAKPWLSRAVLNDAPSEVRNQTITCLR